MLLRIILYGVNGTKSSLEVAKLLTQPSPSLKEHPRDVQPRASLKDPSRSILPTFGDVRRARKPYYEK